MGRKRRVFTDKFKAKVAMEAVKGVKTLGRVGIGISGTSESDIRLEEAAKETEQNRMLMRLIDEQYIKHPEFGVPRMTRWLRDDEDHEVNHKRIAWLMQKMGLQAITPGPHTSKPTPGHRIYLYLLRKVKIERVNQVWSTDITYIPMRHGFMYLAAVIDWRSRYVLSAPTPIFRPRIGFFKVEPAMS